MAHSDTVQFQASPVFSLKPLIAIKDYCLLLVEAFKEAKLLEQLSRKTSGNW
jgi:hypothetical protein